MTLGTCAHSTGHVSLIGRSRVSPLVVVLRWAMEVDFIQTIAALLLVQTVNKTLVLSSVGVLLPFG